MMQRRPYVLARSATKAAFGAAILLYGYQTPTLSILFASLQVSDGNALKQSLNELLGLYGRLVKTYSRDIALLENDPNHIGNNLLTLWRHAVEAGDVHRIQDILRRVLVTVGSVIAAHTSPQLEMLSHGLVLGRHVSDFLYDILLQHLKPSQQSRQPQSHQQASNHTHTSGLHRLTHLFDTRGGGTGDGSTNGLSNGSSSVVSQNLVLRTTADVVGALAGFSVAYVGGALVSTYASCAIGAELVTNSLLELMSELLLDHENTESQSTFASFLAKLGIASSSSSLKEGKSLVPPSVQLVVRQYLNSPTSAFVLKSVLIAVGLSRVPFHRNSFLENALLSPMLLVERILQAGVVLVNKE